MGTDTPTPAEGGDSKQKAENKPSIVKRGHNKARNRNEYVKKEKFLGADPNLQGYTFVAMKSRAEQVANFEKVDTRIKDQIGQEYHAMVLQSLEDEKVVTPTEPTPIVENDGTMKRGNEIKYKEQYSRHLTAVEKIESQLKQVYYKYFGQCDDDMKHSLEEHSKFERAHKDKDVITLRTIIKSVTFNYNKNEDPIKTLITAKKDFTNLKQNDMDITAYY